LKLLTTTDNGYGEWGRWVKIGETIYYCMSTFEEKEIPKAAGFSYSGVKRSWFTVDRAKAAKLAEYAVSVELQQELSAVRNKQVTSLTASRATSTARVFPVPVGLDYFPFQKSGIEYALMRQNTLIGDDMGLGKTIQAIGVINCCDYIKKVLVVCPATLKTNWKNEAERWLVRNLKIGIGDSNVNPTPDTGYDFCIYNYEALRKANAKISEVEWDLVILDEAHVIRNTTTHGYRTIAGGKMEKKSGDEKVAVEYGKIRSKHTIALTGTPICNRPKELWGLLTLLCPEQWHGGQYWYFHKRYCGAERGKYGTEWNAVPPERLEELQTWLRENVMVRRLKSEVMKELPPKIRTVVELDYDPNDSAVKTAINFEKQFKKIEVLEAEVELAKAIDDEDAYKIAVEKLEVQRKFSFDEMAESRKMTALAKLPYAIDYIQELLDTGKKVVVGVHHHEMVEALQKKWPLESITIYGETKVSDRQNQVDRFQMDENVRLAIISIKAGGVGITLTASSTVVVLELPWTPGDLSQFEDRCHRIGQTDTVNVYHLVLRDSIDVKMAKTIVEKQEIIESALNTIQVRERVTSVATRSLTRERIIEEAHNVTPEVKVAIHKALRILAGKDLDHCSVENGMGYNKVDSAIGHSLAERIELSAKQAVLGKRIVKKYSRQLPIELYSSIFSV
jgi:SWI/SNF-related matrix-associated actin-dependent regulator 1 of chromatin subfamily A